VPAETRQSIVARVLPAALAHRLDRWYVALPLSFLAGCVVAAVVKTVVAGRSWAPTAQGIGMLLAMTGVVFGLMLAYGGRASLDTVDRDPSGERRRGRRAVYHPPRPVLGLAEALFCLPTVIVTLTM